MEFGKTEDLAGIDWNLPPQDPLVQPYLAQISGSARNTQIYVGAPAWGCKAWLGRIYPPGTRAQDFLFYYSRNFNCIELNTTYYRIPTPEGVRAWCEKVPPNFIFCPKFPKSISHEPGGLANTREIHEWQQALTAFAAHRGPSFLQLPPQFSYAAKAELFRFLQRWPQELELALEFRHESWFANGHLLPALVQYLQSRSIGAVITDVAGRRAVLHSSVTAPFSLLRMIGNDLHPSDFVRATAWTERVRQWQDWGLPRFYFMVHQPDDVQTPAMADAVISQLNAVCAAGLRTLSRPLLE